MAKSAMPLLLAAGAAALLLTGKKKKKKSSTSATDTVPYEDTTPYEDADPYDPAPVPAPSPKESTKPSGTPPRGDSYDGAYWGATTDEQLESIRRHFVSLGYDVEISPHPMNILGPAGSVTMTNYDNTVGKLGGKDDEPSEIVRRFQGDYNIVSRMNKAEKIYPQAMGGLDTDGMVGPYALNALRYAKEGLPGGKSWPDLLLAARNKGIS